MTTETINEEIKSAYQQLKEAIHKDEGYAWTWHCNIAMPIFDVADGVSHIEANKVAAHLMQHIFEYDMTKHPLYIDWMKTATATDEGAESEEIYTVW